MPPLRLQVSCLRDGPGVPVGPVIPLHPGRPAALADVVELLVNPHPGQAEFPPLAYPAGHVSLRTIAPALP